MAGRKVYVKVLAEIDPEGKIRPLNITWENGRVYEIDSVLDRRRAYAAGVGGTAVRYTISVNGKVTYLFEDEGKWFVCA
ncbi:MAG: hypothetical protein PUB43_07390 [Oscillospiraceae bacterium]|nr:hypothetical protein [Oscillospiraceae bacterium]